VMCVELLTLCCLFFFKGTRICFLILILKSLFLKRMTDQIVKDI